MTVDTKGIRKELEGRNDFASQVILNLCDAYDKAIEFMNAGLKNQIDSIQGEADKTVERILDGHDELESKLEKFQWRPIETAPKDGVSVLVYIPCIGMREAYYNEAEQWFVDSAKFSNQEECRGWWWVVTASGSSEKFEDWNQPTHWMPLPNKPEGEK